MSDGAPVVNVTGGVEQKVMPLGNPQGKQPPLKRYEEAIDKSIDETGKKKIADIVKASKDGL